MATSWFALATNLNRDMTILILDVGNTRLKWALYDQAHPNATLLAQGAVFLEHIETLAEGDWANLTPAPAAIWGCVVAGDAVRRRVDHQLELWDTPTHWVMPSEHEAGVVNGYDHPTRLGADRWVAMVGAKHHLKLTGQGQRPCVVVMVGTAVTVDALDANGLFLGGFILPGHGIMLKALESGTAGLHVPTGDVKNFPTNTSDALTSGGTFAIAGAIHRMCEHVRAHCQQDPICLMTGGAGWKMAPSMSVPFELVDHLIFEGLLTVAQHRQQARQGV
jgi:type III pantothenate kinase